MKKTILLFAAMLLAGAMHAQTDIKTFEGKTRSEFKAIAGAPIATSEGNDRSDPNEVVFSYRRTVIGFFKRGNKLLLIDYYSTNPAYCFLSDYIQGGIKPGDPFEKVKKIDFVKSKYGRNKPGNGLRPLDKDDPLIIQIDGRIYNMNYVAFDKEMQKVFFCVEDGTVKAIQLMTMADAPYIGYDFSNHIW